MNITKINVNGITYDIGSSGSGGGGGGTTDYNALQNQPQINGVTLSGNKTTSDLLIETGGGGIPYFTCSTAAGTAAKVATLVSGTFTEDDLVAGAQILVKFSYANTATTPTLSANGTTAKYMKRYGTTAIGTSAASSWNAAEIVLLVFDGSYWYVEGWINTTYSSMTEAEITAGTGTTARTITPARLKYAIQTWSDGEANTIESISVAGNTVQPDANKNVNITASNITPCLAGIEPVIFLLVESNDTVTLYDTEMMQPTTFDYWYSFYATNRNTQVVMQVGTSDGIVFYPFFIDTENKTVIFQALDYGAVYVADLAQGASSLTGTFEVIPRINYTAGNGIDITNGVISVSYPDADSSSF